jgi:hypothetical protein
MTAIDTTTNRRRFPAQVGIHLDTEGQAALTAEAQAVGLPPAALARVLVMEGLRARQTPTVEGGRWNKGIFKQLVVGGELQIDRKFGKTTAA